MQRKIIMIITTIFLIFFLIGLVEIGSKKTLKEEQKEISIVASIFPAYDFARAVVGSEAEIELLVNPGVEVHSYDPTPMDIVKIQNADIFIYIGGENEAWVETILSSLDTSQMQIIKLMDYVEVLEEEIVEGMQIGKHNEHEEIEYDEHIWTNPKNAITFVEKISNIIQKKDMKNATKYEQNAQSYIEQIEQIDKEISSIVSNAKRKELIFGDRFPFRYFTEAYGLEYAAAFPGCSSETEPSTGTLAYLIEKIKTDEIPVVLYIEMSTKKVCDILVEETGAKAMCLHSCQNVSKNEFLNGVTYVSLMKENINTLKEALN